MCKMRRVFALTLVFVLLVTLFTAFIASADVFDPNGLKTQIEQKANDNVQGQDKMMEVGGTILYAVKLIGLVLAILLIVWFGIQWMTANPQQRAGLKDQAWNYVIGAILLFGSGYIAQWVYDMVTMGIKG